ncbi:MAG: DUF1127 domain-containing protein [Granulosicoccus sp.]
MKLSQKARVRHKRSSSQQSGSQLVALLLRTLKVVAKRASLLSETAKHRSALHGLSDHQLKDIGLTRNKAGSEYTQGFFDLPSQQLNSEDFLLCGSRRSGKTKMSRLPEE